MQGRIFLLVLLVVCFIFIKWDILSIPPSKKPQSTVQTITPVARTIDMSKTAYVFQWPNDEDIQKLPLRVEPTDLYGWWFKQGISPRTIEDTGYGPATLSLDVHIPSNDAFPTVSLCQDSDEPLKGCRIGLARLTIVRDGGWDSKKILDGKVPAREDQAVISFWIRANSNGEKQEFAGWECNGNNWHTHPELLGYAPDINSAESTLLHCFDHKNKTNATQQRMLIYCYNANKKCETHLLYRDRAVMIDQENFPEGQESHLRGMTTITALHMLERMHTRAIHIPSPEVILADALIQQQVCQTLKQEVDIWKIRQETGAGIQPFRYPIGIAVQPMAQQALEKRWAYMGLSCEIAGDIAIRLSETHPSATSVILDNLTMLLLSIKGNEITISDETLYKAWFSTLDQLQQGETITMAEGLSRYLQHAAYWTDHSTAESIRDYARASRLRKLIEHLRPQLSNEQLVRFETAVSMYELNAETSNN